ncbi:hypothetical protein [Chryseobacterium gambrini]|uniref:hypothetical protein n=1 Tax=Chryseobacterium gambrini TaxID=373672 RepID=UPI0022F1A11D|nr:hypothetical protein [Chryseobacterium gambrini]WBV50729.1 hypothetical protein PFY09_10285 [Chryseobacterium gambrini]
MNKDFFEEFFHDLLSYDQVLLEQLYAKINSNDIINFNRFTFEIVADNVLISDDVSYDEIGVVSLNKKKFLRMLSELIRSKDINLQGL